MENVLELKNVTKTYNEFALKEISFNLKKGDIMGFIGPNGAGKSTTIKIIMNLIKKDSGSVKIFGIDSEKNSKELKEKIGFVYDQTYCYENLKLLDMKNIIKGFYKDWDDNTFLKYIKEFELPKNRCIKELSKGMKIKYTLSIALSHKAELIIMDEPTSGLDPIFRDELLDILQSISGNKSIFFSTHITSDLEKIANSITFLNKGKIQFSEDKSSILNKYKIIKGDNCIINSEVEKKLIGIKKGNSEFEAIICNDDINNNLNISGTNIRDASLEDIMVYLVRNQRNV